MSEFQTLSLKWHSMNSHGEERMRHVSDVGVARWSPDRGESSTAAARARESKAPTGFDGFAVNKQIISRKARKERKENQTGFFFATFA